MPTGNYPEGFEGPTEDTGGSSTGGSDWIGALISVGGMLINNYQTKQMAEQQNQWNRENSQTAYDRDLEQWNRQNQYNSPAMQMQRWKEAGLNPNLIYGGSNSGGNASSSPSARVPQVNQVPGMLSNVPGMLSMYQDFRLGQAQVDNVKAQTDLVRQRTLTEGLNTSLRRIMGDRGQVALDVEKQYSGEMGYYKLQQAQKQTRLLGQKWALGDEQSQINQLRMDQIRKGLTSADLQQQKLKAEIAFKQNENQWRAMGITSSDHVLFRLMLQVVEELGIK